MQVEKTDSLASLAAQIDWTHESLAKLPPKQKTGTELQQLLTVVGVIRQNPPEYFGFAADFYERLHTFAGTAGIAAAQARVDQALAGDLYWPPHGNALDALGQETLLLGVDAPRARQIAAMVLARQDDWGRNIWSFGITRGAAKLLACLCVNPACDDAALLPLLGWLCAIAPAEWESARQWDQQGVLGPNGHNWYLCSYFGQWMAAALFGQFRPLQRGQALAPTYLEREIDMLFADDGLSREGAAGYHCMALEVAVSFMRLAERHGVELSDTCRDKLRRIADATWKLLAPDGYYPAFGDTSPPAAKPAGAAKAASSLPESSFPDFIRRLAARFTIPEARAALENTIPGVPAADFLPDNGDDLASAYSGLEAASPSLDAALPESGLYIMRSHWGADADWMAINAMPIGPKVTSHKHADIFNLEICVRGRRVLVDNWYGDRTANDGSYKQDPEITENPMKRRWRVGSSAHNVLTVDDEDSVPVESVYLYGRNEVPYVDAFQGDSRYALFSGVHQAYRRLANPVTAHHRYVFYLRGTYWLVLDRITVNSDASRKIVQHFHLPPGVSQVESGVRTHGPGGNLLLLPVRGLSGELQIEKNPHPISGYENPDHVTITAMVEKNTVMATLLLPFTDDRLPNVTADALYVRDARDQVLDLWEATGIRVVMNAQRDVFVKQNAHWNAAWECAGNRGSGRLFHSRLGEL